MSRRDNRLLLEDIVECINFIQSYTFMMSFDDFKTDTKTSDAVIYNLIKIGEAVNRLPEDLKDKYSSVDWFALRGLRNRIAHDYLGTDLAIIWNILKEHLEFLKIEINSILNDI